MTTKAAAFALIPLDKLRPGIGNLRNGKGGWPEASPELAASIKAVGLLEPLIVRQTDDGAGWNGTYEVIAGHRRTSAAKLAGLDEVPAFIRELTDTKALQVALVENLQREDLSPLEEARGLRQLLDTGMPQTTAAKELGRSQSHVSKRLELLKLSPHAQAYLDAGRLRVQDALALAKLDEPTTQTALHRIDELQFRRAGEVEALIRKVADRAKPRPHGGEAEEPAGRPKASERLWEVSEADLVTFRELSRRRITQDAARRQLDRHATARGLEWAPEDRDLFIALAAGDTKPKPRRRPKGGRS